MRIMSALLLSIILLAAPAAAEPDAGAASGPAMWLDLAKTSAGQGQIKRAYGLTEEAARSLWRRMGFSLARALLVAEPARGYGIYTPRKNNAYLHAPPGRPVFPGKGQPIYVYLEPVGYEVRRVKGSRYQFGITMDAALLDHKGNLLFGKENFLRQEVESHHFNREFFQNVTLNLKGAPPGQYKLRLTVQDIGSGQRASVKLPIQIVLPQEKGPAPPAPPKPKPKSKTKK